MAEAVFKHKLSRKNCEGWVADSAGTAAYHIGNHPDYRTLEVLQSHGLASAHRARQVGASDFDSFDLLVAMDKNNQEDLIRMAGNKSHKVNLLRDFDPLGHGEDVPDPYYGGLSEFEAVYEIVDRSLEVFLDSLTLDQRQTP